jgi:RND family efflux transporter MFP subunit
MRYGFVGLIALLLGVFGTVAVTSRKTPLVSASHLESADAGEKAVNSEQPDEEGGSTVKLDPAGVKSAGIRVEPVRYIPFRDTLTVPGTVEVSNERVAKITPPVAGKITRLLANLGDTVRTGQPLAVLDSYEIAQGRAAVQQAQAGEKDALSRLETAHAEVGQMRAGVAQAQAEVGQARVRLGNTEAALRRQQEMAQAGGFSQVPLQAAQSELADAQSELLQAQNELQTHTAVLQRTERLYKEGIASRAEMEQAQSEQIQDQTKVERGQSRVAIAKSALEREQKVFKGDLLNKQAVQSVEADVRDAAAEVEKARQAVYRTVQEVRRSEKVEQAARTSATSAKQAIGAARANLAALLGGSSLSDRGGLITVTAPFAGVIAERQATQGEAVERTTSLFLLENLNAVTVQANVSEKDVSRIRVGQPVGVVATSFPKVRFPGVVKSLASQVDEKTRTLAVRCLVENRGGRLRPEMFAKVHLNTGELRSVIAVPSSALMETEGEGPSVFVAEGGSYQKRSVKTGEEDSEFTQILEGLKPGDRVVVKGAFVLQSEANKGELKEED